MLVKDLILNEIHVKKSKNLQTSITLTQYT